MPSNANSESLEMLKTEEGQLNAVFACFGSAAQHAQFFEAALSRFLLTCGQLEKKCLTVTDLEALDKHLQKKTLGLLLRQFSEKVKVSDDRITTTLTDALQSRNFLMHRFFLDRADRFKDEPGRFGLLAELTGIEKLFDDAATITRAMDIAVSEVIAGTRKKVEDSSVIFSMELGDSDKE